MRKKSKARRRPLTLEDLGGEVESLTDDCEKQVCAIATFWLLGVRREAYGQYSQLSQELFTFFDERGFTVETREIAIGIAKGYSPKDESVPIDSSDDQEQDQDQDLSFEYRSSVTFAIPA